MDIEGFEVAALKGAKGIIECERSCARESSSRCIRTPGIWQAPPEGTASTSCRIPSSARPACGTEGSACRLRYRLSLFDGPSPRSPLTLIVPGRSGNRSGRTRIACYP